MRVYIIGNDGITLCLKASATLNDGRGCRCIECIPQFLRGGHPETAISAINGSSSYTVPTTAGGRNRPQCP
jgi:hypothetical protein